MVEKVGDDDVGLAVAVDVRHRQGAGAVLDWESVRGQKSAVALAQQHTHAVRTERRSVGDDEIGDAVAVDVCHRHCRRPLADREGLRGQKSAVALAQQHTHAVRTENGSVGDDEIGDAVAVDVCHRQRSRGRCRRGRPAEAGKSPSPLPSSTLTVLSPSLRVMMSGLPSSLRSATATATGSAPTAKGC